MEYLTLLEKLSTKSADGHWMGLFQCSCGNRVEIICSRVRNGYTKSCGCLKNDPSIITWRTHGMRSTDTYSSWRSMKYRCMNSSSKDYHRYGGAGITVSREWIDSFEIFLAHMGERPKGTSLDRIDGSKGYIPGNCRWGTAKQQNRNKVNFVMVKTPLGSMPLVDYAAKLGITRGAAHLRLKREKLEGCVRI